jgi:hypothetical protein
MPECQSIAQEVYSNCLPMTGTPLPLWFILAVAFALIASGFLIRHVSKDTD